MSKVTTFLMFPDRAEEAVRLYTSVIPNSRVGRVRDLGAGPSGDMKVLEFELDGRPYAAMDGGPDFSFSYGMSLVVVCDTQQEIDAYTTELTASGGEQLPCGWVKDRFGVSWQIVPRILDDLLADTDKAKAKRALEAMLAMQKIDIAELRRAHAGQEMATPRT